MCLSRKPSVLPRLEKYLDDEDPLVRAAAAESLGFIFRPSFAIPIGDEYGFVMSPRLNTTPPIDISGFGQQSAWSTPVEGPDSLRQRLETMMLQGPTSPERTAAARALVSWPPPSYSLRIAEWGVWIDDGGQLKLVQSVLDEIPPFVHQTGNAAGSFADRINQIMVIRHMPPHHRLAMRITQASDELKPDSRAARPRGVRHRVRGAKRPGGRTGAVPDPVRASAEARNGVGHVVHPGRRGSVGVVTYLAEAAGGRQRAVAVDGHARLDGVHAERPPAELHPVD